MELLLMALHLARCSAEMPDWKCRPVRLNYPGVHFAGTRSPTDRARTTTGLETALHYTQSAEVVCRLIAAAAAPLLRDNQGRTALFQQSDAATVKALVAAGVDVNARDLAGNTALESSHNEDQAVALVEAARLQ
jgi:hypothetical protein